MNYYICRKCGQLKDNRESEYDFYLDGVICAECKKEEDEEDDEQH
jgi:hypothetical protein